jgi:hypothetical protein
MTEILAIVHCCRLKNPVFHGLDLPPSSGGTGKEENLPCWACWNIWFQSQGHTTAVSNGHMRVRSYLSTFHLNMEIDPAFMLWVF